MEQRLKERVVGAAVIVAVAVLVIPEFLSGPERDGVVTSAIDLPAEGDSGIKTHTIVLDPQKTEPPAPVPVSEPPATRTAAPAPVRAAATERQPRTPAAAADTGWAVQLGSFSSEENATRLAGDLEAAGFDAEVSEHRNDAGRVLHRVRVGPVPDRRAAETLARRLEDKGHTGRVVPHP